MTFSFVYGIEVFFMEKAGDFNNSYPERKSRIMKWLSKLFKSSSSGRRGGGSGGYNPHYLGEENMVVRAPGRMPVILLSYIVH